MLLSVGALCLSLTLLNINVTCRQTCFVDLELLLWKLSRVTGFVYTSRLCMREVDWCALIIKILFICLL